MLQNRTISTVQSGRDITSKEIEEIQEIVNLCWRLSRNELALTVSENLQWFTASGTNKADACIKLLEKLETQGVLRLPEKRVVSKYRTTKSIPATSRTAPQPDITCELKQLGTLKLEVVNDKEDVKLWKEYISRYHYLGYNKPFGYYLRYFFKSDRGILGCALFSGSARAIAARDRWIGWTERQRKRNHAWVINNTRLLIFPWVKVKNLASHVLGQINRQISRDWKDCWGFNPVLMETFVDPHFYQGTSYKAANWLYLGMTTGQGLVRKGKTYSTTPKMIFIKPLTKDCRSLLCSKELVA